MPGTEGGLGGEPGPDKAERGAATPAGRQLGLDSRDIPGGQPHVVNPESTHHKPVPKDPRPLFTDERLSHGVADPLAETHDGWEKPSDEITPAARPAPVPKFEDAVPVRIVQGVKSRVIRVSSVDSITVPGNTANNVPVRICNIDLNRVQLQLLNEDTANDVRVGQREDLITGKGALISHFTNSYLRLHTQDEMFALGAGTAAVKLSVITETEVAAG
jgi:hypothetical protein